MREAYPELAPDKRYPPLRFYNHISARIPGTDEFLLNPFGLMYEEICASAPIKMNQGRIKVEPRGQSHSLPRRPGHRLGLGGNQPEVRGSPTGLPPIRDLMLLSYSKPESRQRGVPGRDGPRTL